MRLLPGESAGSGVFPVRIRQKGGAAGRAFQELHAGETMDNEYNINSATLYWLCVWTHT